MCNQQNFTGCQLLKNSFKFVPYSCLGIGASVLGKLMWNGFKMSILDSSIKGLSFQAAKFSGWAGVAMIVGSFFGSFLPCLICRKPNPKMGLQAGRLSSLGAVVIQGYLFGSAALPLLGYAALGGALIVVAYRISVLVKKAFCPNKPVFSEENQNIDKPEIVKNSEEKRIYDQQQLIKVKKSLTALKEDLNKLFLIPLNELKDLDQQKQRERNTSIEWVDNEIKYLKTLEEHLIQTPEKMTFIDNEIQEITRHTMLKMCEKMVRLGALLHNSSEDHKIKN